MINYILLFLSVSFETGKNAAFECFGKKKESGGVDLDRFNTITYISAIPVLLLFFIFGKSHTCSLFTLVTAVGFAFVNMLAQLLHKGDITRLNDLHDADFLLRISDIDGIQRRLLLGKGTVDTDCTASASHSVARADNGSETRQCRPGMDSLRVRLDAFHRTYRSHAENSSGIRTWQRNESLSADLVCPYGGDFGSVPDTWRKAVHRTDKPQIIRSGHAASTM